MATKRYTVEIELTGDAVDELTPLHVVNLVWTQLDGNLDDRPNPLRCTDVGMNLRDAPQPADRRATPTNYSPDAVDTDKDGRINPVEW
jgi:hypothetical protein